jgi:hypothetical protein
MNAASSPDLSPSDEFQVISGVKSRAAQRRNRKKLQSQVTAANLTSTVSDPSSSPPPTQLRYETPAKPIINSKTSGKISNSGPNLVNSSPPHQILCSPSLNHLHDLFPLIGPDLIFSIYSQFNRNFNQTVDFLLHTQQNNQNTSDDSNSAETRPTRENQSIKRDFLSQELHLELLIIICDHLDVFTLSNLAQANAELHGEIETNVYNRVKFLSFHQRTHWPDQNIVLMIEKFPSLAEISLKHCESFASWHKLSCAVFGKHITTLNLSYCDGLYDNDCAELIGGLDFLRNLVLQACINLSDEALELISHCSNARNLVKVNLSDCKGLTNAGITRFLEKLTRFSLISIDLRGTHINKALLSFNSSQYKQLQAINLSNCVNLSHNLVIKSPFCELSTLIINNLNNLDTIEVQIPSLTSLNLSNNKYVKNLTLFAPNLLLLNLSGCINLRNFTLFNDNSSSSPAPPLVTALREVNLNLCRSLLPISFSNLLNSCVATLESLQLRGCIELSNDNLYQTASKAGRLISLDCSGCKQLDKQVVNLARTAVENNNNSYRPMEKGSSSKIVQRMARLSIEEESPQEILPLDSD